MNNTQNGPKPGWQTTEFATTVLSNFVATALATHAITQAQANTLQSWVPLIGAIIIYVVVNASYIRSRTQVKVPWEQALATLIGFTGSTPSAQDNMTVNKTMGVAPAPITTPMGTSSTVTTTITPIPGATLPVTDAT